jgi:hypothetical protein
MEIGPISAIRAVSPLKPIRKVDFVSPAFTIDGSGRAGDDAYAASSETDECDREEDVQKADSDSDADSGEDAGETSTRVAADSGLDVLA